jgi:hypothetical protein
LDREERERRDRILQRGITKGLFEAILLSPAIRSLSPGGMEQVEQLVKAHEWGLAFDQLTAIIMKHDYELSEDLWAIVEHLGEEMRIEPKGWHGLREKMDSR